MYLEENRKMEESIRMRLSTYFGNALHDMDVLASGKIVTISVRYEDFKPMREVRKDIEAMDENVVVTNITRTYSVDAVKELLYRWYEDREFILDDDGRRVDLFDKVEEVLFDRNFQESPEGLI